MHITKPPVASLYLLTDPITHQVQNLQGHVPPKSPSGFDFSIQPELRQIRLVMEKMARSYSIRNRSCLPQACYGNRSVKGLQFSSIHFFIQYVALPPGQQKDCYTISLMFNYMAALLLVRRVFWVYCGCAYFLEDNHIINRGRQCSFALSIP